MPKQPDRRPELRWPMWLRASKERSPGERKHRVSFSRQIPLSIELGDEDRYANELLKQLTRPHSIDDCEEGRELRSSTRIPILCRCESARSQRTGSSSVVGLEGYAVA